MSRSQRNEFGDWKFVKCLGSGGRGNVHLWQNQKTRRKIAVKSLKCLPDHQNQRDMQRWKQEIAFVKEISHDNMIHAVSPEPISFVNYLKDRYPPEPLIMEYCEKGDLRGKLNNIENLNGMSEAEVRNVVQSLQNAVVFLHSKGITHRDIKPENLVIKEVNGCEVYKLTDLGFAREIIATVEASNVGTFEYFAPEVIKESSYSNTVDYWSMGVIVFEVICGTRPFVRVPAIEYFRLIGSKGKDDIAITRSPQTAQIQYHSTLFDQNHISSRLKSSFEGWLRTALSVNPRLRSCTDVDRILSTKVLTVFCLHNFHLYSYVVTETTSRQAFLQTLARDTGIPVTDIVIILPPENTKISHFNQTQQPINLYMDDFYNEPMVHCTTDKDTLQEKSLKAGMSHTLSLALAENTVTNLRHGAEVAKQMMFYVQLQGRYCNMFLKGLQNYAVMVDYWIVKYQKEVEYMVRSFWELHGATKFHLAQVEAAKQMLDEKNITSAFEDNSDKTRKRLEKCSELFFRTHNRFSSVFRRSQNVVAEICRNHESFLNKVAEICDLNKPYEIYNKFRDGPVDVLDVTTKEMFRYFNTFQQGICFIHSAQIINIQKMISEIHEEFELIIKLVDKFVVEQKNMHDDIKILGNNLNKSLLEIASTPDRATNDEHNIPDLDNILSGLKLGVSNGLTESQFSVCNGAIINDNGNSSLMSISDDGLAIVEENNRLCDRLQKILKDRVFDDILG